MDEGSLSGNLKWSIDSSGISASPGISYLSRVKSQCSIRCYSLRRGMETRRGGRGGDAAAPPGPGYAHEDTQRSLGCTVNTLTTDICTNDRGVPSERIRPPRIAPLRRRSPRADLHAVRRLRQLRGPGSLAPSHGIHHC